MASVSADVSYYVREIAIKFPAKSPRYVNFKHRKDEDKCNALHFIFRCKHIFKHKQKAHIREKKL